MELKKLIDDYLYSLSNKKTLSDKSVSRYRKLLDVFYDYITIERQILSESSKTYLNGFYQKDMLDALGYYVKIKGALSEDTADMYISVVREFFKYIWDSYEIGNDGLIKSFALTKDHENSFVRKYLSYLGELLSSGEIKPSVQGIPFNDDQVKLIVDYCNSFLDFGAPKKKCSEANNYNHIVKSLAIKLVTYLGISVEVLNAIRVDDLDLLQGIIKVNGFYFHIPYFLRQQFEYFEKCTLKDKTPSKPLFSLFDGKTFSQANVLGQFINNCLEKVPEVQNPSSLTSLAKYAIIQFIDAGIARDTIIELTGYKEVIFESCNQLVEKIDSSIRNRQIDSLFKQLPAFDYL